MLISWKMMHQLHFFAQRRTITSVTITKNNGGKIARESSKIREKLKLDPKEPPLVKTAQAQPVYCTVRPTVRLYGSIFVGWLLVMTHLSLGENDIPQ